MNMMKVQVQYTCPACQGSGTQKNPDHNPNDIFPESMLESCGKCGGNKTITEWVSIEHFLRNIAELDIQF